MSGKSKLFIMTIICMSMAWSSPGLARCTSAQISGFWEAAFSDGNSCRLKLVLGGKIDVEKSVCYDPDRGSAGIDSGTMPVNANCFSEGEVVIGGVTIELPVQFSADRNTAAGRYRVTADGSKGLVVMVREP